MSISAACATTGPALAVLNLSKRFAGMTVISDISFSVPGGSFFSLLGPSGSGKTTVLRLLAGLESPDEGSIVVDGADVSRLPPHRRNIGMVFQRYALFPHMSVADNVGFPLKQRGVPRAARNSRAEEILETVGLPGYGDRRPAQLSGGQQQRVALARALVFNPRMLLMDEPLAALDRRLRERMQQEIRALQRRLGITTVYVTHDQTEAFVMSDRVAIINGGRIEQIDAPRTLYESPRSEFVAQFVGSSNLFCGASVDTADAKCAIRLAGGALLRYPSPQQSGPVTLLVRPEKIAIHAGAAAPLPGNVLRGRVADAVFLGEALVYRIAAGDQEVIVREQNHQGAMTIQPGTDVTLSWAVMDTIVL